MFLEKRIAVFKTYLVKLLFVASEKAISKEQGENRDTDKRQYLSIVECIYKMGKRTQIETRSTAGPKKWRK